MQNFCTNLAIYACEVDAYLPKISPVLTSYQSLLMSYVVASKLKDLVKKHGMMSSGDLADAVSKYLEDAVAKACDRAKANGRKTVRSEDL